MVNCQAIGCGNDSSRTKTKGKSYYRIPDPAKDRQRCAAWLAALKSTKFDIRTYKVDRNNVVCSDHFSQDRFEPDLRAELMGLKPRRRLKSDAVPNLFAHKPVAKSRPSSERRLKKASAKEIVDSLLQSSSVTDPSTPKELPATATSPPKGEAEPLKGRSKSQDILCSRTAPIQEDIQVDLKMGRICGVIGCANSTDKLKAWMTHFCDVHPGLRYGSCICKPPFELFPFPLARTDPEGLRRWTDRVNRKRPSGKDWAPRYDSRICSKHFKDGRPTSMWPDPTEYLGVGCLKKGPKIPRCTENPPDDKLKMPKTSKRKYIRKKTTKASIEPVESETISLSEVQNVSVASTSKVQDSTSTLNVYYFIHENVPTPKISSPSSTTHKSLCDHDCDLSSTASASSSCTCKAIKRARTKKLETIVTNLKSRVEKDKARVYPTYKMLLELSQQASKLSKCTPGIIPTEN